MKVWPKMKTFSHVLLVVDIRRAKRNKVKMLCLETLCKDIYLLLSINFLKILVPETSDATCKKLSEDWLPENYQEQKQFSKRALQFCSASRIWKTSLIEFNFSMVADPVCLSILLSSYIFLSGKCLTELTFSVTDKSKWVGEWLECFIV